MSAIIIIQVILFSLAQYLRSQTVSEIHRICDLKVDDKLRIGFTETNESFWSELIPTKEDDQVQTAKEGTFLGAIYKHICKELKVKCQAIPIEDPSQTTQILQKNGIDCVLGRFAVNPRVSDIGQFLQPYFYAEGLQLYTIKKFLPKYEEIAKNNKGSWQQTVKGQRVCILSQHVYINELQLLDAVVTQIPNFASAPYYLSVDQSNLEQFQKQLEITKYTLSNETRKGNFFLKNVDSPNSKVNGHQPAIIIPACDLFVAETSAQQELTQNLGLVAIPGFTPENLLPYGVAVGATNEILAREMTKALQSMYDVPPGKQLSKIEQWEKDALVDPSKGAIKPNKYIQIMSSQAQLQAKLREQKVALKVGLLNHDSRPLLGFKDGEPERDTLEAWLFKEICTQLNTSCQIVQLEDLESRVTKLQRGEVHIVIGQFSVTKERLAKVDFVEPYYYSSGAQLYQLTQSADNTVGNIGATSFGADEEFTPWSELLADKRLCIQNDYYYAPYRPLKDHLCQDSAYNGTNPNELQKDCVVLVKTRDEVSDRMRQLDCNMWLDDSGPVMLQLIEMGFKVVDPGNLKGVAPLAVAVAKGQTEIYQKVQDALNRIVVSGNLSDAQQRLVVDKSDSRHALKNDPVLDCAQKHVQSIKEMCEIQS